MTTEDRREWNSSSIHWVLNKNGHPFTDDISKWSYFLFHILLYFVSRVPNYNRYSLVGIDLCQTEDMILNSGYLVRWHIYASMYKLQITLEFQANLSIGSNSICDGLASNRRQTVEFIMTKIADVQLGDQIVSSGIERTFGSKSSKHRPATKHIHRWHLSDMNVPDTTIFSFTVNYYTIWSRSSNKATRLNMICETPL